MPEHTLELVRTEIGTGRHKGKEIPLPSYDVVLNGTVIGTVRKDMITRERRPYRGARYVTARWQSPGWRYRRAGDQGLWSWLEVNSRTDGIERLIRQSDGNAMSWTEVETLADTVRTVR